MAPPAVLPRLDAIAPKAFAREVYEALRDRLRDIEPLVERGEEGAPLSSADPPVLAFAEELARWARDGDGGDAAVTARAVNVLEKLIRALYQRPIDTEADTGSRGVAGAAREPTDLRSTIGVVLAAAAGRARLGRGEPIPAPQLAALASVSKQRIAQFVGTGELRRTERPQKSGRQVEAPFCHGSAVRWLGDRGVAGFARAPKARSEAT